MSFAAAKGTDLTWDERLRKDLEIPDRYKTSVLWEAVQSLPTMMHDIVVLRYGGGMHGDTDTPYTMEAIAAKSSITRQSINQTMIRTKLQILQSLLQTEKGE